MKPQGGKPRVWVTWITGLLSGDDQCQWAAWVKSRYWYRKRRDDNFDSEAWRTKHTAEVEKAADMIRAQGATVSVENENDFEFEGNTATLAGKMDLVALVAAVALVVDVKTGKVRSSDYWQVLVYMLVLPKLNKAVDAAQISGEVVYSDHVVEVPNMDLSEDKITRIYATLRMIGGPEPKRTPSKKECRFCNIDECPERFQENAATPMSDRF